MLAITFIAALGQPPKLISGYTWSPNPIHPATVFWRHRSPRSDFDPQAFSREQLNVSYRVSTFDTLRDLERRYLCVRDNRNRWSPHTTLESLYTSVHLVHVVFVVVFASLLRFLFIAAKRRSLLEIGPVL